MSDESKTHSEPTEVPLHEYIDMDVYDVVPGEKYRALEEQLEAAQETQREWAAQAGRLHEQLEVMQRERDTWKGAAEYQPSSWSDLWGRERERADELQEQLEAAQASLYAFQNCMERNGADCNEHLADAMRLVGASNPTKEPS